MHAVAVLGRNFLEVQPTKRRSRETAGRRAWQRNHCSMIEEAVKQLVNLRQVVSLFIIHYRLSFIVVQIALRDTVVAPLPLAVISFSVIGALPFSGRES